MPICIGVRTFAGVGMFLVLASTAKADQDFGSGNFMLPHCQHFMTDNYRFDVWDGDCGGTIETLLFLGRALPDSYKVCRPKGATASQAGRIVVNYMQSHPQDLHQPFRGLAMTALHEAWPCN
ncbi:MULTISPECIES: Rap1a/Tai family immunity protein [Bradyrhizobium]|uniref:Rap1a/Tai family immunity protein n=1 Tax=Bradyrhizobium TaxID=374 RepID=UPI00361314AE